MLTISLIPRFTLKSRPPSGTGILLKGSPGALFSLGWRAPTHSACLHRGEAPALWSSSWPSSWPTPIWCPSCVGHSRTGHNTPGWISREQGQNNLPNVLACFSDVKSCHWSPSGHWTIDHHSLSTILQFCNNFLVHWTVRLSSPCLPFQRERCFYGGPCQRSCWSPDRRNHKFFLYSLIQLWHHKIYMYVYRITESQNG